MNTIWFPDLSASRAPKYQTLTAAIRSAIVAGTLEPGEKLPPVREVAYQLGITPGTVARAYSRLTEDGVLAARVGRGTFVRTAEPKIAPVEKPLITHVNREIADFRGCRVADVGQGRIIGNIMQGLGADISRGYVDYPTSATDRAAREAVCQWIGPDHVGRLEPHHVVLGNGAQNTVMMVLQACLSGPNPVVLTDELAYPGVRHAGRLLRAQLVGVKMDKDGIRPDAFEQALREHGGQVLLTSAEVHSPTTIRTSYARKVEIAAIAQKYQIQILEDDCHRTSPTDIPAYRHINDKRAWYISSLTKSVSGALRFGYAICPPEMARTARQVAQSSFYGIAQPILDISHEIIASGQAEDIRKNVCIAMESQVRVAVNALGRWDINWRPDAPFIWLKLPQGWRASRFAMACERAKIDVKPADEFALPNGGSPHAVRLSINSHLPDAQFLGALETMNHLLANPEADIEG